jgi:3-hydroxyisobutyrate dehydrogenase-like beta-hydroxyacid dehydrogenase
VDGRSARGMNDKVTVIGAGRMGSALATALFHKGFRTTVWNRTASKTEALSKLGLSVAPSIQVAIREADVVIVNIGDYRSTRQLLEQPNCTPRQDRRAAEQRYTSRSQGIGLLGPPLRNIVS